MTDFVVVVAAAATANADFDAVANDDANANDDVNVSAGIAVGAAVGVNVCFAFFMLPAKAADKRRP